MFPLSIHSNPGPNQRSSALGRTKSSQSGEQMKVPACAGMPEQQQQQQQQWRNGRDVAVKDARFITDDVCPFPDDYCDHNKAVNGRKHKSLIGCNGLRGSTEVDRTALAGRS